MIPTLVYVVTYRMPSDKSQSELTKFTKESAESTAKAIQDIGGVAVITEDVRVVEDTEQTETHPKRTLQW